MNCSNVLLKLVIYSECLGALLLSAFDLSGLVDVKNVFFQIFMILSIVTNTTFLAFKFAKLNMLFQSKLVSKSLSTFVAYPGVLNVAQVVMTLQVKVSILLLAFLAIKGTFI